MTGYLLALAALIFTLPKGYSGKKLSLYISDNKKTAYFTMLRMIISTLISLGVILISGNINFSLSLSMLAASLLSGLSTAVFVSLWLILVRKSAYILLDVFLMLGCIIPISVSALAFGESVKFVQISGYLVLIAGALILCSYSVQSVGKINLRHYLLLVLCGAANGTADLSQKIFVNSVSGYSAAYFSFYTFLFSSLLLLVFYLFQTDNKKNRDFNTDRQQKPVLKKSLIPYIYVIIMACSLYFYTYLKTLSGMYLDSIVLYTLMQSVSLMLSLVMAAVFFGEKINLRSLIGTSVSFLGLLLINVI